MKTIGALVVYMLIGGLFMGSILDSYRERCPGQDWTMPEFAVNSLAWPAFFAYALTTERKSSGNCPVKEAAK